MVKVRVDGARRSRKPEKRGKEPENTPKATRRESGKSQREIREAQE